MTRLTEKKDWKNQCSEYEIQKSIAHLSHYEWVKIAKAHIDIKGPSSLLELGGCPGQFSRLLASKSIKNFSAIDFVNCREIYSAVMKPVAKNITFINADLLFRGAELEKHDVVCSFGLIEHFSGNDLNKILSVHDLYLNENGYLIIEIPNMAGIKFLWHFIFDNKNLRLHNLRSMNLKTFEYYKNLGYKEVFKGYTDSPEFWGWSSLASLGSKSKVVSMICFTARCANKFLKITSKLIKFRNFFWSSFILYIAIKPIK